MSHVQNCTESITFQGFNAKADDPGLICKASQMDSIQKLVWKQRILQIGVLPHCKLIREISLSINIVWLGGLPRLILKRE